MKDFAKNGIVSSAEEVHSLRRNADEIWVNGKKMIGAVSEKFKNKYPHFAHCHNEGGNLMG